MTTRSVPIIVAVGLAAWIAPAAAGARGADAGRASNASAGPLRASPGLPRAPASEQTHPAVHPARGRPTTRFVLELTIRQRLGAADGLRADYRVAVTRTGGGCAEAFTISTGAAGARLRERLRPPTRSGWCRGTYTGVVTLDRAPSCTPLPGGRPVACPDFVLAPVTVGRFGFTVV